MTGKFAASTEVTAARSRDEIERTLSRYGATAFAYGWEGNRAVIQFAAKDRRIRFELPLPDRNDKVFVRSSRGPRSLDAATKLWEQAQRQAWRALLLVIKAKLEAVEARISTFENEFLANIVLPNGDTVGRWIAPQIALAYEQREMPPMLPDYRGPGHD